MRRQRRDNDIFSLSFLDCICCGFGAIILLFVISVGSESRILEGVLQSIESRYRALNLDYSNTLDSNATAENEITRLREELANLERQLAEYEQEASELNTTLASTATSLAELEATEAELTTALSPEPKEALPEDAEDLEQVPIGIPMDRNYLVFIIDTSGSMRELSSGILDILGQHGRPGLWREAMRKIEAALNTYPEVHGLQFLDADGRYIIEGSRRQWLEDSTLNRRRYFQAVRNYPIFSQSNPVPGIEEAIRRLSAPDKRIALFVVGDEFTGNENAVLRRLESINARDSTGVRPVSINAIGFPTPAFPHDTARKYANLMREITHAHDGAFIGSQR